MSAELLYMPNTCQAGHPALDRSNPAAVATTTTYLGAQKYQGEIDYHLRNCIACGSTLCITIEIENLIRENAS